jgi:hypothetical protein
VWLKSWAAKLQMTANTWHIPGNARPVSCHHPMNAFIRQTSCAGRQYGRNWIETGIYLGKADLGMPTLFNQSDNKKAAAIGVFRA